MKQDLKDKLIRFMQMKNEMVVSIQGRVKNPLPIYNEPLEYYIEHFDDNDVKVIIDRFKRGYIGDDGDLCPSCIVYKNDCSVCDYGKKHLKCDDISESSRYARVIRNISDGIVSRKIITALGQDNIDKLIIYFLLEVK